MMRALVLAAAVAVEDQRHEPHRNQHRTVVSSTSATRPAVLMPAVSKPFSAHTKASTPTIAPMQISEYLTIHFIAAASP